MIRKTPVNKESLGQIIKRCQELNFPVLIRGEEIELYDSELRTSWFGKIGHCFLIEFLGQNLLILLGEEEANLLQGGQA